MNHAKQNKPFIIKGEKKTYAWCSCGLSANQPFCDGGHKGTNFKPIIFDNNSEENIALCGCKESKNPPFCDGTHSNLFSFDNE
jgi:CDGSH-type Zn-finger protein